MRISLVSQRKKSDAFLPQPSRRANLLAANQLVALLKVHLTLLDEVTEKLFMGEEYDPQLWRKHHRLTVQVARLKAAIGALRWAAGVREDLDIGIEGAVYLSRGDMVHDDD